MALFSKSEMGHFFSCKASDSKYFTLYRLKGLMQPGKSAVVTWKDPQTYVNEWAWLVSNKTLFTNTPSGLDLVHGPDHSGFILQSLRVYSLSQPSQLSFPPGSVWRAELCLRTTSVLSGNLFTYCSKFTSHFSCWCPGDKNMYLFPPSRMRGSRGGLSIPLLPLRSL